MKAVLLSIKPKYCELIASGRKTMELRKTRPKLETPFKCYIYCTKAGEPLFDGNIIAGGCKKDKIFTPRGVAKKDALSLWDALNGKVIGEFLCDYFLERCEMSNADLAEIASLVKREKIFEYSKGKPVYGWHISGLVIYDKPKEMSEFLTEGSQTYDCPILTPLKRPPQSWCYVEELT